MAKKVYKIKGMDCASCASLLEMDLEDAGISAKVSYPKETLEVADEKNSDKLKEIVEKSGFKISQ